MITRALAAKSIEGVRRDQLLTMDRISSVGLFVVGSMALAEACGVAMQSILTVGGIGGEYVQELALLQLISFYFWLYLCYQTVNLVIDIH